MVREPSAGMLVPAGHQRSPTAATAMASGWAEAFEHAIKERDKGNAQALARILAAITEEAGDLQTATRILRERVEADERAIVDEAVRMMAQKQSRAADWHWASPLEMRNGTKLDT